MLNEHAAAALAAYLALPPTDRQVVDAARAALEGRTQGPAMPNVAALGPQGHPVMTDPGGGGSIDPRRADIPRLYGPAIDTALFASAAYKAIATTKTAIIYFGGCDGLYALSQMIGRGCYKLGLSAAHSVHARMTTLGEDSYASIWKDGGVIHEEDGYDRWEAASLPVGEDRPPGSPVESGRRYLRVRLPEGVSSGMLDKALATSLADRALNIQAESADGKSLCAAAGVDPRRLIRYSPSRRGDRQPRAATELVHVSPRRDADAMARLIEAIIARAVLARPAA